LHDDDLTGQAVVEWLDNFGDDDAAREENRVLLSSFFTIFVVLLELSVDPYPEVATNAQTIVDYVIALLLESPFTRLTHLHSKSPSQVLRCTNAPTWRLAVKGAVAAANIITWHSST